MAQQDQYTSAYSPVYGGKVDILKAWQSHHADWLFQCKYEIDGYVVHFTATESQLSDFE